jgi:hypothetical protein
VISRSLANSSLLSIRLPLTTRDLIAGEFSTRCFASPGLPPVGVDILLLAAPKKFNRTTLLQLGRAAIQPAAVYNRYKLGTVVLDRPDAGT